MAERNSDKSSTEVKIISFFGILSFSVLFITQSTFDDGDSIMHYLFAHGFFYHPENWFNHWAKPLFTMLCAPFAFWGWTGMKIFNTLIIFLAAFFSYKTSEKLNLKFPVLAFVFCYLAPQNFLMQYSGLTEPLFGLFIIFPIFLWTVGKKNFAIVFISFIPFVRSEGMIVCIIWIVFLLLSKEWKKISLIFTGLFFYSIAGWVAGKQFLWYFTDNPYAGVDGKYGSGPWYHFIIALPDLFGIVNTALLATGLIYLSISFLSKNKSFSIANPGTLFIILGCFTAYFFSHSYFWYKGINGSFGMTRVIIALTPLMAIINLYAINFFISYIKSDVVKRYFVFCLSFLSLLLILLPLKTGSFNIKKDFSLNGPQKVQNLAADWMIGKGMEKELPVFTMSAYLPSLMDIDPFDLNKLQHIFLYNKGDNKGKYILWESWYAPVEGGMKLEALRDDKTLTEIKTFNIPDKTDRWLNEYKVVIFKVK